MTTTLPKTCQTRGCDAERCFYCGNPLSKRHLRAAKTRATAKSRYRNVAELVCASRRMRI